ncbi:MAG: hypothetical protein GX785_00625 [Armatimonadetes bacterium]|nr:hypothetical protein [Armatimonadota bacterium]
MRRVSKCAFIALLAATLVAPAGAAPEERVVIDGYLQARAVITERPSGVYDIEGSTFTIRRARVRFRHATEIARFVVELEGTARTGPVIRDAYVQIPFHIGQARGPFTFWVGQFQIPFGYAVPSSSRQNLFPELPVGFVEDTVGLALFPDLRDVGLRLSFEMGRTQADLAVVNGPGLADADPNRSKEFYARIKRRFGSLEAALSGRISNQVIAGVDRQHSIWGIGAKVTPSFGGEFTAEFATGRDAATATSHTTPRTWYIEYDRPLGGGWLVGARYSSFDPDIDNVGVAGNTGEERGAAFALAYQFDEHLRLTGALEFPRVTTSLGRQTATAGIFQTQYSF